MAVKLALRAPRIYTNTNPAGVRESVFRLFFGTRAPAGLVLVYILGSRKHQPHRLKNTTRVRHTAADDRALVPAPARARKLNKVKTIPYVRNSASRPEIGFPGRFSAGF